MREDSRFVVDGNRIFKPLKKDKFKVRIDDRFKSALSDTKFNSLHEVKGKKSTSSSRNELGEYYRVDDDDLPSNNRKRDGKRIGSKAGAKDGKGSSAEERLDYLNKLARGDISGESSEEEAVASDEESECEEASDRAHEDSARRSSLQLEATLPEEQVPTGEATSRLAVMNCDWQNLRALDLMMVLQSFCPAGIAIRSVNVYPSDFGLKEMARENALGPQGIWNTSTRESEEEYASDDEEEEEDDDGDDEEELYDSLQVGEASADGEFARKGGEAAIGVVFHNELCNRGLAEPDSDDDDNEDGAAEGKSKGSKSAKKDPFDKQALRLYELSKLRYYFAVVECDTVATASILYDRMDGMEFEHSAMAFDLRFIPDDVRMDGRECRDTCLGSEVSSIVNSYVPPDFVVKALQHTNVDCTWDEGEKIREKKLSNLSSWRTLQESDFQQYIASDDSSDEDDDKKDKMRALLLGEEDSEDAPEDDDFFAPDPENNDEDVHKVATFIPDHAASLREKRDAAKPQSSESPFEQKLKLMADSKAKKKSLKKSKKGHMSAAEKADEVVSPGFELMFSGEDDLKGDYNIRDIVKGEKEKGKKKKRKNSSAATVDDFKVDLGDARFSGLLAADGKFGIDPSSTDFQETPAMKSLLKEQRKRSRYA